MGSLAQKPLQLSGLVPSMISLDPRANSGMQNLLLPLTTKGGDCQCPIPASYWDPGMPLAFFLTEKESLKMGTLITSVGSSPNSSTLELCTHLPLSGPYILV